jgi:hypothetical protein
MRKKQSSIALPGDFFENLRVKYIKTLPYGGEIITIWLELLAMALKNSNDGVLYKSKDLICSSRDIHEILKTGNRSDESISKAINTLIELEIIEFTIFNGEPQTYVINDISIYPESDTHGKTLFLNPPDEYEQKQTAGIIEELKELMKNSHDYELIGCASRLLCAIEPDNTKQNDPEKSKK